jgi:hypothetical protein
MKVITNTVGEQVSYMGTIGKYFRHADEKVADFMNGCKALTLQDKEELAVGAAREMGWTVTEQLSE